MPEESGSVLALISKNKSDVPVSSTTEGSN